MLTAFLKDSTEHVNDVWMPLGLVCTSCPDWSSCCYGAIAGLAQANADEAGNLNSAGLLAELVMGSTVNGLVSHVCEAGFNLEPHIPSLHAFGRVSSASGCRTLF